MDGKLREFMRKEIMNRFLASRPDYPRNDAHKLDELSNKVVQVLNAELPSMVPFKEPCSLYDKVDEVADRFAATLDPCEPSGKSPMKLDSDLWDPLPAQDTAITDLGEFHANQLDFMANRNVSLSGNPTFSGGIGSARQAASSVGVSGTHVDDDRESCGSSDTALADVDA